MKRRMSLRTIISAPLLYLVLIVLAVIYIFPFLISISTSFKTPAEAASSPLGLIPSSPTTEAYRTLFSSSGGVDFPRWFLNSAVVTIVASTGRVIFDSMAGYALARIPFRGRSIMFGGLVAVMAVPSVVMMIPKFLVLKELGIYNTYYAMIIPLLVDATGVFIMKGFFEGIPIAIEEQARIDGAGPFRLFWSIVLPMARPALMTLIILSFQGTWNELSHFVIATSGGPLSTLTQGVSTLTRGALGGGYTSQPPFKLAAAVVMTIPVVIVFFIFQKRMINTQTGGVKE